VLTWLVFVIQSSSKKLLMTEVLPSFFVKQVLFLYIPHAFIQYQKAQRMLD